MKELSIEEKAKAYDEAIEIINDYYQKIRYSSLSCASNDIEVLERAFPQLKESEDKRVKMKLIEFFKGYSPDEEWWGNITQKDILAWLEKQGEQKPVDKVEPKFKVGDYIVSKNNSDIMYKITGTGIGELCKPDYICEHVGREKEYNGRVYNMNQDKVDSNFKIFNIQDAKDGDVLAASDGSIFLFKVAIDCACKHYVALTTDYVVKFNEGLEHYWETSRAVHPATKEQRDTLMKAMADAGYTFDFEKKELKKIEQKSAWSKKDEEMYKKVETAINSYYAPFSRDAEEMSEWFKKLKGRVQPQPKQEWSEADEEMLNLIIARLHSHPNVDLEEYSKEYDWLKNNLKSLKDRVGNFDDGYKVGFSAAKYNQWKPSDLPHWKKSTLPNDNTTGFNSDYFCHKGYYINYKELFEKLPKDD